MHELYNDAAVTVALLLRIWVGGWQRRRGQALLQVWAEWALGKGLPQRRRWRPA